MRYGGQNEVGTIKELLLGHPRDFFQNQNQIDNQWQMLNYRECPEYESALKEYDKFLQLLKQVVTDIHFLPASKDVTLDGIYVRDTSIITNAGIILCTMGKKERSAEPSNVGRFLPEIEIPVLGVISGEGKVEGGDLIWLDEKTLVVGRGYRSNDEGIRQLRELTVDIVDEVIAVPLPHWKGPGDVFHLMSFISPIDVDLAVVYSRLMPVPFRELLIDRGITLVDVPDEEYLTMACNILAVAPRKCIMLSGNPQTKRLLEKESVEVWAFEGKEISYKGAGGPTCLTRPLHRDKTA